ncbi:unnamed protein product [Parnassius mnemosyne]|uniref:Chloride channel CLIC-like protein 1 n=1 Tax=Parnassius mnemosyne TaxID=213953 RepID=A0AAV1MC03_9NEOP
MKKICFYLLVYYLHFCRCMSQIGPDPWDYESNKLSDKLPDDTVVPPDLRAIPKHILNSENKSGMSEWFYRRILAIVLKAGQIKKNDDDSIDVSLQMKFDQERWMLLNDYITSNKQFTEDMFRRSVGYIEDSIYKPSITEKIVMAWDEYIHFYLVQYKTQITWILTVLAIKIGLIWLWSHMSHKHIIIISVLLLYLYEVFISYKEAEKQEVERFLSAVHTCKWYIWSSNCEVPPPDPLIFLKHMNPLKIGIRMFTTLISEPILTISDCMKTITHGITDGLWFPLDKIMFGLLIVIFNTLLIFLLIMIMFNFILNIPFNLSFLGLISIGLKQRNRTFMNTNESQPSVNETNDRISGATLDRLLDVCSRALSTAQASQNRNNRLQLHSTRTTNLRRSASTGRLPNFPHEPLLNNNRLPLESMLGKSNLIRRGNGSGDA